jgi:hypothetical protein
MSATFLATAPRRVNAVKLAQLRKLVRGTRYSISTGSGFHGQPAYTLCFEGSRQDADAQVIADFYRITAP